MPRPGSKNRTGQLAEPLYSDTLVEHSGNYSLGLHHRCQSCGRYLAPPVPVDPLSEPHMELGPDLGAGRGAAAASTAGGVGSDCRAVLGEAAAAPSSQRGPAVPWLKGRRRGWSFSVFV